MEPLTKYDVSTLQLAVQDSLDYWFGVSRNPDMKECMRRHAKWHVEELEGMVVKLEELREAAPLC